MLFECLQDVLGGRAGFFLAVINIIIINSMVSWVMLPGGDQHHELNDDRCSVVDDSDNADDGDDDDDDINPGEQLFGCCW